MPILRIRDNTELKENEYRILVYDNILFSTFLDENEIEPYRRIIDDVVPLKISYLQIKEELKKRG